MNTCIKCGCDDAYPSLPPCPVPVDCPNPQPCAEFFDAQCVVYTLKNITCGSNIVVAQDSSIAEALESIVLFFCTNFSNSILSITDNGAGGVYVNNADPLNPIISFTGIFVDGTLSGDGTFANPLSVIAGGVQSVTGLDTDNTDPLNPIVQIAVDGITITGLGTPASPLVATAGGGSITGSGTVNYLARWTPTGTQLGIGLVQDNNSTLSIGTALNAGTKINVSSDKSVGMGLVQTVGGTGLDVRTMIANAGPNTGVVGYAANSTTQNVGLDSAAIGGSTSNNIGVRTQVSGGLNNYGAQFEDGTEGIGKVLTCVAANGKANWVTPSGGGSQFTYEIGEYVPSEGGIIVNRWLSSTPYGIPTSSTTQNYIVMDLVDLSAGTTWGLSGTYISTCGSTWDGFTNTANIIAAGVAVGTAAQLCSVSTNGGKTDWYLPAVEEFATMSNNKALVNINVGLTVGFTALSISTYWCSTEYNAITAATFYSAGYINSAPKTGLAPVRAVRRFNI